VKLYLIALTVSACSGLTSDAGGNLSSPKTPDLSDKTEQREKAASYPEQQLAIRPGEVFYLKFPKDGLFLPGHLWCGDQKMVVQPMVGNESLFHTLVSESYFSTGGEKVCLWRSDLEQEPLDFSIRIASFKIVEREYPKEFLKVNPRTVNLDPKDFARAQKEQELLQTIYANFGQNILFDKPFVRPLNSAITSHYGIQRIYNGEKKGQHLGVDFRAKVGVPIPTSNKGKVVLAQELFYLGNTVIIDHGLGLFTIYGHLSEILVNLGDVVPQGGIIGKTGNTGRSSGPHLHWGVRVGANLVDGMQLIKLSKKEWGHGHQIRTGNH